MRLAFLTFAPLRASSGHTARLRLQLKHLSARHEVSIVCLRKGGEDFETRQAYEHVKFFTLPTVFRRWEVEDLAAAAARIVDFAAVNRPDLMILMMEVWDLMRELGKESRGRLKLGAMIHAMPFLASPLDPSGDFQSDVLTYCESGIEEYKRSYILAHYKEAPEVLKSVHVIANNQTASSYIRCYFPWLRVWTLAQALVADIVRHKTPAGGATYDFVYMARMEAGKGVEYLTEILSRISQNLFRTVRVAVLGRADDQESRDALAALLAKSSEGGHFHIDFHGWLDGHKKASVLSASSVFLYPSHLDNYPTVLSEALAFGLPCIVWDVPFARINYASTNAVQRARLFDFQQFADCASYASRNLEMLKAHVVAYTSSFPSPEEVAELDGDTLKQIASS